jgi:peptide/nickel transport system permease protein
LKGYRKYFLNKFVWLLVTAAFAFILNFLLPRLMPGNPIAGIIARLAQGMSNSTGMKAAYERYATLFGTNKPMIVQFFLYVKNVAQGNFGVSFSQYPRTIANIIQSAVWWTVCLQFPAIIVGWQPILKKGLIKSYCPSVFSSAIYPPLAWQSFCWSFLALD